jgi:hypothetical protein
VLVVACVLKVQSQESGGDAQHFDVTRGSDSVERATVHVF